MQKSGERDRILGLFRRGRIDEATLEKQMDEIEVEAAGLRSEIDAEARALSCADRREQLNSAEALLASLRKRLDKPISHELKRRIVGTWWAASGPTRWSAGALPEGVGWAFGGG
jgi:hypothetical protein